MSQSDEDAIWLAARWKRGGADGFSLSVEYDMLPEWRRARRLAAEGLLVEERVYTGFSGFRVTDAGRTLATSRGGG